MEMQINELVSAIKKEGVDAAQAEAEKIIAAANEKAAAIIAKAQSEADALVSKAQEEIEILKQSAKTTAEHAKRDAMLCFKKSVQSEFELLLGANAQKAVGTDALAKLIIAAINDDEPALYTAEVAEITEGLKAQLKDALEKGLEIKVSPAIKAGFKLTAKDGSGYFDCSDEELENMLAPFFPELII